MRTSRISQETAKITGAAAAASSPARRSTRSSLAHVRAAVTKDEAGDIEDAILPPRKRKRAAPSTPRNQSRSPSREIKPETEDAAIPPPQRKGRTRKPARKIKDEETGDITVQPPSDWAEIYSLVKTMRTAPDGAAANAVVDTMGCAVLADRGASPRDQRFQTLVALMLSSQTKDTTTAAAIARLKTELAPHEPAAPAGLNLENILAVDAARLNELIGTVGFHNAKTRYIKATAVTLRDRWAGDIPDTAVGLMSLPGVGPKMAHLCMSAAWGRTEGIGVDVHVHRITNRWGWHATATRTATRTPEETRLALESWLPRPLWHEINALLVGLGQTLCLPVGIRCGDCDVGLRGLCKAADPAKVAAGRKARRPVEREAMEEEGST